ncbi:MAG TPA: DUF445 domain-containing protein [Methylomirabilota bacterium]|nr:DUF445 domain-containing protein [Methylomirabilota bacterium]
MDASATGTRRPPRQRRLASLVLLTAVALAAAAIPFRATWWGGWILAIAEAGIVGGVADWFAVTALFRHPLGVPVPHTAIIPANWELLAERVGTMVGDRVLTKDYVIDEISRFDLADLIARGASHVKPDDLESAVRAVARWAAGQISPEATRDLAGWLTRLARSQPVAPLLATGLEVARKQGWDQRVIQAAAAALVEALERPGFRAAVGDLVDEVVAGYRARMSLYPRLLVGLASAFGLIDRERLLAVVRQALQRIAADPDDPLRARLTEMLGALPGRLRHEPALAARVEAAKEELLDSPAVTRLLEDAAAALGRSVVADLGADSSEVVAWITARLESARVALADEEPVRRTLDRWLKDRITEVLDRYHDRVARFIERGVHALGPEGAVRLIEEHAGDDLQYIRVNGTVVGGLAGGALYAIHLLLGLL